jgi:hypothetical protein
LGSLRHYPPPWTGGRVVEGARLESVYAGNRIVGSNPTPSAIFLFLFSKYVSHSAWERCLRGVGSRRNIHIL